MARVQKGEFGKRRKPVKSFSMQPQLGESGYKPSEFYIPATDAQGHSARLVVMVAPELKREIQAFIAQGFVPIWRTEGDLLRWCIIAGLDAVMASTQSRDAQTLHGMTKMSIELQQNIYDRKFWATQLASLTEVVAAYVHEKQFEAAYKTIQSAEEHVHTIGDSYWQKRYLLKLGVLKKQVKRHEQRHLAEES